MSDATLEHRLAAFGATARDQAPRWGRSLVDKVGGGPTGVATMAYFA